MRFLNLLIAVLFSNMISVMICLTVLVLASEAKAEEKIAVPYKAEFDIAAEEMLAAEWAAKDLQSIIDEVIAARVSAQPVAEDLVAKLKVSHNELANQLRVAANAIAVVIDKSIDFSTSCEPMQDGLDACIKRAELTIDIGKILGQGQVGLTHLSLMLMLSETLIKETSI